MLFYGYSVLFSLFVVPGSVHSTDIVVVKNAPLFMGQFIVGDESGISNLESSTKTLLRHYYATGSTT
jgi:hypothetical protein